MAPLLLSYLLFFCYREYDGNGAIIFFSLSFVAEKTMVMVLSSSLLSLLLQRR
jgi:hypothetical protein